MYNDYFLLITAIILLRGGASSFNRILKVNIDITCIIETRLSLQETNSGTYCYFRQSVSRTVYVA